MASGRGEVPTLRIDGARILFPNFAGEEGPFNAPGVRSFCVVLDPEDAERLAKEKWNVKYLDARDEGDADTPYMNVRVSFKYKPPMIVVLTSNGRRRLTEDQIDTLDYASMANVDLLINGSWWEVQGKSGYKGYVKTMFITLDEDELERKYADIGLPDLDQ